jgi:TrmH family RNA methyltransferase
MKMNLPLLSKNHHKWIRRLHQKKYRQEEKAFIAEGLNSLKSAMEMTHYPVKEVIVEKNYGESIKNRIPDDIPIYTCSRKEMESISTEETPQGIVIICRQKEFSFDELEKNPSKNLLYLDKISDPGNLGTILRTAAWFNIKQILMSPFSVDLFNTKVTRASAGAIFGMEIYQSVDFDTLFQFAKRKNYKLIAAVPEGGTPVNKWEKTRKNIILLGHEAKGLSKEIIEQADRRISISSQGNVESLNLAIAAAIILYEIAGR